MIYAIPLIVYNFMYTGLNAFSRKIINMKTNSNT